MHLCIKIFFLLYMTAYSGLITAHFDCDSKAVQKITQTESDRTWFARNKRYIIAGTALVLLSGVAGYVISYFVCKKKLSFLQDQNSIVPLIPDEEIDALTNTLHADFAQYGYEKEDIKEWLYIERDIRPQYRLEKFEGGCRDLLSTLAHAHKHQCHYETHNRYLQAIIKTNKIFLLLKKPDTAQEKPELVRKLYGWIREGIVDAIYDEIMSTSQ